MRPSIRKGSFTVVLTAFFAGSAFGSPLSSRLLSLVPPGAGIVAGFENHTGADFHGRLLLATHNNRLDLEDFQSLTGVDSKRVFDEVIEVAAAAPLGGSLSEHMLLVAGQFDRERIFSSIELNGAGNFQYQGQQILLIRPLTRERGDMVDTRWMVILDNRTGIFGTSWLVKLALRRYAQHAATDSVLEERLSLLRRDVTSWNVLVNSAKSQTNINFEQPHGAWAQLQQDADVLMVAARFGSKIRVDFSIHANAERGPEFFTRKAGFFTDALLSDPKTKGSSSGEAHRGLENFFLEPNRVQGSVYLSSKQFAAWCEQIYMARAGIMVAANGD